MLNPEPKPLAKSKRRATYGESRERMKKRADVARARGKLMRSNSSGLCPVYPETLSPFRHRSNSSASSCDDTSMSVLQCHMSDDTSMSVLQCHMSDDTSSMSVFPTDDSSLSQFRSRSYSNTSSASQNSFVQVSQKNKDYPSTYLIDLENVHLNLLHNVPIMSPTYWG